MLRSAANNTANKISADDREPVRGSVYHKYLQKYYKIKIYLKSFKKYVIIIPNRIFIFYVPIFSSSKLERSELVL